MAEKTRKRNVTKRLHFTDKRIAALTAESQRVMLYDAKVDALGLKIEPSGTKTFFWFRAVPDEQQTQGAGRPTWKRIGEYPATSLDVARNEAQRFNTMLDDYKRNGCKGPNPFRTQASATTLNDLAEAYIARHLKTASKDIVKSEYDVRSQLKLYLNDWKHRAISTITRDDVVALHEKLGKTGHHRTANACVNLLRRMFNWAEDANFAHHENPAARIKKFREEKRDRFLQPDEMVRLYAVLDKSTDTMRDFVTLALETAMRRSSICAMRWADIKFPLKLWTIPDPKNREPHNVELTAVAVEILEKRFAAREKSKEPDNPWVLPSRSKSGHLMDPKRAWVKLCKAAGITNATVHDLRRTRASYMALAGASLLQIGQVLGHKSAASTQIYARLNQQAQRESMQLGHNKMRKLMAEAQQLPAAKRKQLPESKTKRHDKREKELLELPIASMQDI